MSDYVIVTDSSCDLPAEWVATNHVEVIPLSVDIDGKTYRNFPDERDIKLHDFYQMLRAKKVGKTTQLSPDAFVQTVEPLLKEGKDILALGFSSALSGTYNSMRLGAEELRERYPDRKMVIIDTLSASLGQGMLVYRANELKQEGKSLDTVAQYIEDNKLRLNHLFTVDDLGTLKRGGRLTASLAFIGTILNLKPVMRMDNEGRLVPWGKKHGRKVALRALIERMEETIMEDRLIFISHGDCLDEAEQLKATIVALHPNTKVFLINHVGPVIGAHSGPGTMALFFFGRER